jgi:PAS domain S-box-containing protein
MINSYLDIMNENQEPVCISNYKGRILHANMRFCRMFGFSSEEVDWHFLLDLHRNVDDWFSLQNYVERFGVVQHFYCRMKNRQGRSFPSIVSRERIVLDTGEVVYFSVMQKVASIRAKEDSLEMRNLILQEKKSSHGRLLYLMACDHCLNVRDANGNWIQPGHKQVAVKQRGRKNICPSCAAKLYPHVAHTAPARQAAQ